jgi:hypothetical protein
MKHTFNTLFILRFIISFWVPSCAEYILLHFGKEFILLGREGGLPAGGNRTLGCRIAAYAAVTLCSVEKM